EGGGVTTDAANQVAAQLAELLRSNPDALRDVLAQAGQSTGSASGQVHQHPLSRFDKQKESLVKGLGSLVEEVRQMNRNLRRSEQSGIVPLAAQYGDVGADRIEQLSKFLSGRNVTELVAEAASFAQRNATYLVPGAFLLGLMGARFLKSSNPMQAETAGLQNGRIDVDLPVPPPPLAGDITMATAGGAMHDRTTHDRIPQPAQADYTSQKQDAEDEEKSFARRADRGIGERDDPTGLIGGGIR
ncbi:MAG: hypothetical protein H0T92_09365, partial [Pyrinomonadaceae bacterium]|nr:hypothetical protein [Pyrinomonadaceae bacterium]